MNDTELIQKEIESMQNILGKVENMTRLPDGFTMGEMLKVTHILNTYFGSLKVQGKTDGSSD
jgi:hypothetical protein